MTSVAEVVATLQSRYDPQWTQPWDAVGLVCGDPSAEVRRVHFAIDPVEAVADEALAGEANLLVTHHPLFLGGTTTVAADSPKGRVVHRLVTGGCALFVAHTNADVANPGVSDALAAAIGLQDVTPIGPPDGDALDKVVTFVPAPAVDGVVDALAAAGAGGIGDYSRCAFFGDGVGTFLPGPGASPTIGSVGEVARVEEVRVEMALPRARRTDVVRALQAAHPYEEPAYDVVELAVLTGDRGLGRLGELPTPMSLHEFTARVADRLPATAWGVRAAGDPGRRIRRVAVCGGSGGELATAAKRNGADVLVTSDLKHHSTSETVADHDIAMVDAAHWATEWPWLGSAAGLLVDDLAATGTTVETTVSSLVTDPWTVHRHPHEDQ